MLEARHVTFTVGQKHLIRNVDMRAAPGQVVAIVGPNGAGKSTLLKALAGELHPSSGIVCLDGEPVSRMTAARLAERRAVMPQSTHLAFPFTVREVVGLGRSVPGFGDERSERHRVVDEAMQRADLTALADRTYTTLSGGERQRVHLARALCQLDASKDYPGTRVLLLDEPTASLDLAHQILILEEARRIARENTVVVAVLHDLNLAYAYADQVALMSLGKISACGHPRHVLTDVLLSDVFGCEVRVNATPHNDLPYVLPQLCRLKGHGETETCKKAQSLLP